MTPGGLLCLSKPDGQLPWPLLTLNVTTSNSLNKTLGFWAWWCMAT